ncbi:sensor histidine kinase [Levilactobacillus koreensis]|uniref:histidine kinase n=1 Tax=Levilactobacillus koreensis TaxID=637971 RepID=A0AAC8UXC0_9LACO|nr:HAMP domain-containing sensor histidine kinase [Levilactobacillus koreensis]AKP65771.1 hypothetical protein ABN16_12655 [Levilactobacillus koreensis]
MWVVVIVILMVSLGLGGYLFFLKRQIRQLTLKVRSLPKSAGYGGRLFVDFREDNLIDLVTALNAMVDDFERENSRNRRAEKQLQLSITGLSHDLRTPLTAINGYVQLLQQVDDPDKRAQYLTSIQQAVSRLMTMTDGFYDLTRLDAQQKRATLKPVALSDRVETEFLGFFEQFEAKQIQVAFDPSTAPVMVQADDQLLTRVLQNIIQNALRYAQNTVTISYQPADDWGVVCVSNDVAPDSHLAIQRVFDQFYTASASRTNPESTGLGLYLSRQLVLAMGGKLTAELVAGQFTIRLALAKVAD